LRGDTA